MPTHHAWPWDQGSRNTLLGYMMWLTSRYRMSHATLIRGIDVLDRCAAPSRRFGLRRDPSAHRYLLGTACLFVAFKFDDGVECRCIPEQGLPFERVEPTRVWRHAAETYNALPLCRAVPSPKSSIDVPSKPDDSHESGRKPARKKLKKRP